MRFNVYAFNLFCLVQLLTGCQTSSMLATQTIPATLPPANTSSLVLTPTSVAISTLEPTITPTTVPDVVIDPTKETIKKQCPQMSDYISAGRAKGTLVINQRGSTIKLLNLETGKETDFAGGFPIVVSPLGDLFAYNEVDQNTLAERIAIGSLDNLKQKEFAYQENWFRVVRWQNEHTLLIREQSADAPYPVTVLDVETGAAKSLLPNFPNISLNMTDWDGAGSATYNAMIDRVIYAGWHESSNAYEYVLWDMLKNKQITSLVGSSFSGDGVNHNAPEWSPDGSQAAVISTEPGLNPKKDEIYALKKDGKIQRLTYFADQFEKVKVGSMTWSPDGKKLAFWITLEPGPYKQEAGTYQDERLAILNTESFDTTLYCISGDSIGPENGVPSFKFLTKPIGAPIWSPDGTWIVVENRYTDNFSRLILLDTTRQIAFNFRKDTQPSAWIANYP